MLGVLASEVGKHDIGLDLIRRAIAIAPAAPELPLQSGRVLAAMGRADEAIAAYRRVWN